MKKDDKVGNLQLPHPMSTTETVLGTIFFFLLFTAIVVSFVTLSLSDCKDKIDLRESVCLGLVLKGACGDCDGLMRSKLFALIFNLVFRNNLRFILNLLNVILNISMVYKCTTAWALI